jgi:RHS repeat-associated protein
MPKDAKQHKTRHFCALQVASEPMQTLALSSDKDYYTRAANEDCVNGGPRTRTKYAYDANGNVTSRNGRFTGWTSYNYPDNVSTATESALFNYGPNRQRWSMVYNGPAGQEITYYATPLYETMFAGGLSTNRHYIYAGGRPVVEVSTYNGVVTVRSLLVDHQGSISSVVTDSTGASLVSESFTAYGNRREASTWTGAPTSGELTTMNGVTRQGYTFQTVLGSMGLNHMNGRIEDSVTGRFLSPDPFGTNPGNTQSYNRYSYVNNNPLTFIDPTGFGCISASDGSPVPCDSGGPTALDSMPSVTVPVNSDGSYGDPVVTAPRDSGGSEGSGNSPDSSPSPDTSPAATPDGSPTPSPTPQSPASGGNKKPPQTDKPKQQQPDKPKQPDNPKQDSYKKRLFGTHWCGPGGDGPPVSDLDAACKAHDQCYDKFGLSAGSNFNGSGSTPPSLLVLQACNQALCNSARVSPANGAADVVWYFMSAVNGACTVPDTPP